MAMAVSKATAAKAEPASTAQTDAPRQPDTPTDEPVEKPEQPQVVSDCVVNGGTGIHVGRAVNGRVCSYHAMRYHADGTPR